MAAPLLRNHPLVDGNKRLGWLATAVFLELNGVAVVQVSDDDVYGLVGAAAAGNHSVESIAGWLRAATCRTDDGGEGKHL